MTAIITQGDAANLPLPTASVDLIVTSPPYFGLRSYSDGGRAVPGQIGAEATLSEYMDHLIACTAEWMRVLKPGGSIFVNLGDKYGRGTRTTVSGSNSKQGHADPGKVVPTGRNKSLLLIPERYRVRCVDDLDLTVRAVVIWEKSNPVPESARDRVSRIHEDWVHLTLSENYYSDVERLHTETRWPGSVWETRTGAGEMRPPTDLRVAHFAPFPMEWPRRIIEGWCPANDGVVLDPFSGTGTTALVASALGRTGIGVDLSADYCRLARWRVTDPAQRAKAIGTRLAEVVEIPGQAHLFEEEAS